MSLCHCLKDHQHWKVLMTGIAPLNRVFTFRAVLGRFDPSKALSLLYVRTTGFNVQRDTCYFLPTQCIHVVCMGVRTNSCYFPNTVLTDWLLGAFADLRKMTVLSCLSSWNNSAPTGRIFMKFDIYAFFEKVLGKFKFR